MNVQPQSTDDHSETLLSEINVTPFVDVMLVLLIIFMVTAPLIQQGVKVALPTTKSEGLPKVATQMVLTVTGNRHFYLNEQQMEPAKLYTKLQEIYRNRSNKEIFLRADQSLSYGFIVDVMARVKKAGISNIGLVTEPGIEGKSSEPKK